jgi:hypothetical protein
MAKDEKPKVPTSYEVWLNGRRVGPDHTTLTKAMKVAERYALSKPLRVAVNIDQQGYLTRVAYWVDGVRKK